MVKSIEVEIGEKLAGEIADWQAAATVERREEIITVKIKIDCFLPVGTVDDQIQYRQRPLASDPPPKLLL